MKKIHLLLIVLIVPALIFAQQVDETHQITRNYTIGDFNSDGYIDDIAHFNFDNNAASIQIYNSTGTSFYLNEPLTWQSKEFEIDKTNGKIVSGDFDNDGFMDDIASICHVGIDKTKIYTWINNNGTFEKQSWWYGPDFNANQVFNTMVSGDFDNDGFVDDIAAFYDYQDYTTKVFVWKSDTEKFNWPTTMWNGNDFDASRIQGTIVSGDFDQDGFIDDIAAFYNYYDDATKVFVWQSNKRKFVWPRTAYFNRNFDVDKLTNQIVSGDFDADGFIDDIVTFELDNENEVLAKSWSMHNFKLSEGENLGKFEMSKNFLVAGDFNKDNTLAEILDVNDYALNIFKTDKDYVYYPENWLTLKNKSLETNTEKNFIAENNIHIFPTVSNNYINVNFDEPISGTIELYDMLGKQTLRKEFSSASTIIDVNNVAQGTYILNISSNEINHKEKITVH